MDFIKEFFSFVIPSSSQQTIEDPLSSIVAARKTYPNETFPNDLTVKKSPVQPTNYQQQPLALFQLNLNNSENYLNDLKPLLGTCERLHADTKAQPWRKDILQANISESIKSVCSAWVNSFANLEQSLNKLPPEQSLNAKLKKNHERFFFSCKRFA